MFPQQIRRVRFVDCSHSNPESHCDFHPYSHSNLRVPLRLPPLRQRSRPRVPSNLWRGLITIGPENRCSPYDSDEGPLFAVGRTPHRRGPGRHLRPLHRHMVREHQGNRHRTHRRPLRGPRQRPLCRRPSNLVGVRIRPPEPHAGVAQRESSPEERQRRDAEWLPELNQCWYVHRIRPRPPRIRAHVHRPRRGADD